MARPSAILFDIDGTLVDSTYLHVDAWQRGFAAVGVTVPAWRIHRCIGMDSQRLLDELVPDLDDATRAHASEVNSRLYLASADRLSPLPGAIDLLDALRRDDRTVALATSAPGDEFALLRRVLQLPDDDDRLVSTQADDVVTAKPAPDVVATALERAGVDAEEALFVGDAEWDMIAARDAGVRAIGVLSGGIGADLLRGAGAVEVVDDVDTLARSGLLD